MQPAGRAVLADRVGTGSQTTVEISFLPVTPSLSKDIDGTKTSLQVSRRIMTADTYTETTVSTCAWSWDRACEVFPSFCGQGTNSEKAVPCPSHTVSSWDLNLGLSYPVASCAPSTLVLRVLLLLLPMVTAGSTLGLLCAPWCFTLTSTVIL